MTHFQRLLLLLNANLYSRMADKLSKGSNSSTLKNLSVEIGDAGQSYGNTKNCNIDDNKNKTKKKKKKKKG